VGEASGAKSLEATGGALMKTTEQIEQAAGLALLALLLTAGDIARLAQVSEKTVRRWDHLRKLPGRVRLPGRSVRWRREAILRFLEAGCVDR